MTRPRLKERRIARAAARHVWIECDGDMAQVESAFKAQESIARLDPMTVIALIQIAIQLWSWWKSRQIKEPSVVASSDEPIDMETDDDE